METDLLIGADKGRSADKINQYCLNEIYLLRKEMNAFIYKHPEFVSALEPLDFSGPVPDSIQTLLHAAKTAGIGPMGGVAGLFSMHVGQKARKEFNLDEIIVENGGDIYAYVNKPLQISLYAGSSPLSGKVNIRIQSGEWGICTSSGTVGHSLSFGKADALTIISKSAVIADALATRLANKIQNEEDIQHVLELSSDYSDIKGIVIIVGAKIGLRGEVELC